MAISSDGTGAPCTKADTAGVKGKDGKEARTREVKVLTVTFYDRVDRRGRPIVNRSCIVYFSSTESAEAFAERTYAIVRRMGYCQCARVQFVSDGAAWLEKMWRGHFRDADVLRVVDFYHAAQYLHVVVAALCARDGKDAADAFRGYRRTMERRGGEKTLEEIVRDFGEESIAGLPEEARKAWAYLKRRTDAMDYGRYRPENDSDTPSGRLVDISVPRRLKVLSIAVRNSSASNPNRPLNNQMS